MYKRVAILVAMCLWLSGASSVPNNTARVLADEMMHSMDRIITLSGRMKRSERMADGMSNGECRFKLNVKPRKIYFYNLAPEEGAEILYRDGWNGNKAYVHPNKFPWVNVSLGVYSDNFQSRQHHSFLEMGFGFMNGILHHLIAEYGANFDTYVKYVGKKPWYGKQVDVLEFKHPDYGFVDYTIKAGEDLVQIQDRLKVPAYKILEINPGIEDKFDVTAGQVIRIPNRYAKEMVVMIDPDLHLPIVQLIFDEKGLFEKYEFHDLKVNPVFNTMEFSEDNEEYGF